ncbi:MAG TPA: PAS domain S-box protein [Terriglobia bacterium]|nr:PAS domain S-box protein [Terriglobia bacterium]
MKSSLVWKAAALFAVALAGLGGVGYLQLRTTSRLSSDYVSLSHTNRVIAELQTLRRFLNRSDASAQSYILTGDPGNLEDYHKSADAARASFKNLRTLTALDPEQQRALDTLSAQISASMIALQAEINSREATQSGPQEIVKLERAIRESLDAVRLTASDMEVREEDLLRARREAAERTNQQARSLIVAGTLGASAALIIFMAVLFFEIMERQRSEAKFKELLESAPDSIVIVDREGRIVLTNVRTEQMFGYDRGELLGQKIEMLIPERFRAKHHGYRDGYTRAPVPRAMGSGFELFARKKDGSEVPVDISLSPIVTNGDRLVSSAIRDITARKEIEQALTDLSKRMLNVQIEERRRVSLGLHDNAMQTLTAMTWKLALANEHAAAGEQAASVQSLEEGLSLAHEASRQLRTFSYLLYPPELDGQGLPQALKGYVEGYIARTGIQVKLDVAPNVGRIGREIETALFNIVQECLANIHRHSDSKAAEIRLARNTESVSLQVRDFGKGFQGSVDELKDNTPVVLGVGIQGMKARVRRMHGQLEIAAAEPGTVVRVSVPSPPQTHA